MIDILAVAFRTVIKCSFVDKVAFVAYGDLYIHAPIIAARSRGGFDQFVKAIRAKLFIKIQM